MIRWLALFSILTAATALAADDRSRQALDTAVAHAAAAPFLSLQVLSASSLPESRLRWATWGEGVGKGQTVYLALLARHRAGAVRLWLKHYPEGYLPTIRLAHGWTYHKHPVLVLTFQYGAAVELLVMVGLDSRERPVLLDERMASLFEFRYGEGGLYILAHRAIDEPNLCFRPQPGNVGLMTVACPEKR